ncbi:MAG: hypothetical protein MI747_18460 [Desulfobacterales bacterium]|nr:hypothetical protein [Desulfobacterales bacterium]
MKALISLALAMVLCLTAATAQTSDPAQIRKRPPVSLGPVSPPTLGPIHLTPRMSSPSLAHQRFHHILVAGMQLGDLLFCEFGYGYVDPETESPAIQAEETLSYYVSTIVTLADGVFVIPEIGFLDPPATHALPQVPEQVYYGVKWQISF